MNFIKTMRRRSIEFESLKYETLENRLELIDIVTKETEEDLKNIRYQRQQAQKIQAEKELNSKQYLDYLLVKFKKRIKEQHAFRYQQELLSVYHQQDNDNSTSDNDDDKNNGFNNHNVSHPIIPLPYVLMKQAKLLKSFHLIEVYSNQWNMIHDQMENFKQSMTQKENMLKSVIYPSYDNRCDDDDSRDDNNSKNNNFVMIEKDKKIQQQQVPQMQLPFIKLEDLMVFRMQPVVLNSSPTLRHCYDRKRLKD